jgi:hypothetical protein
MELTKSIERKAEAGFAAAHGSAVRLAMFESENLMAITSPCGHTVPIERAIEGCDRYCCPVCGMRYRVEQEPAKRYPSGFVMPGDRHIVIEPQSNLPLHPPNDPSSATRRMGGNDCNRDAPAGFAAAHG